MHRSIEGPYMQMLSIRIVSGRKVGQPLWRKPGPSVWRHWEHRHVRSGI